MTTTPTITVCPRCGTIAKSGKSSCCGRGGSWFKSCGGTGKANLHHTWYAGIQVCKSRLKSKTVVGQKLNVAQQKDIGSSHGAAMTNDRSVIANTRTFVFMPVATSIPIPDIAPIVTSTYTPSNVSITTPALTLMANTLANTFLIDSTHTSVSTAKITQGCENVLQITVFMSTFCL